jgi:hypothetical protein
MSLLQATPLNYYNSKYQWDGSEGATNNSIPRSLFTIASTFPYTPNTISDFTITINGETQVQSNYTYAVTNGVATVTFTHLTSGFSTTALTNAGEIAANAVIDLILNTSVLGDYRYISLKDIVGNFIVGYVGDGKLVNTAKRSEILFQAKRCIQEFAYDISRVEKIQEVEIPPSLSIPMPQDYVNYVRLSWVDNAGIEHIVYPSRHTSVPTQAILQDSDYDYLYDVNENLMVGSPVTNERFRDFDANNLSGTLESNDYFYHTNYHTEKIGNIGQRFGGNPENMQENGLFIIDEANGKISFSSNLKDKLITFKYISDGLATDNEMKIHKFAEDAMYQSILFNLLSTRIGVPEFIINRYRRSRRAAMRNAKIRLSNLKVGELTQVMRGKSKHIKH